MCPKEREKRTNGADSDDIFSSTVGVGQPLKMRILPGLPIVTLCRQYDKMVEYRGRKTSPKNPKGKGKLPLLRTDVTLPIPFDVNCTTERAEQREQRLIDDRNQGIAF